MRVDPKRVRTIDGIPPNHRTKLTIESTKYHTQFSGELLSQRSLERPKK